MSTNANAVKSTVTNAARNAVRSTVADAVSDAVKSTATDAVADAAKNAVKSTVADAVADAAKNAVKSTVTDADEDVKLNHRTWDTPETKTAILVCQKCGDKPTRHRYVRTDVIYEDKFNRRVVRRNYMFKCDVCANERLWGATT